MKYNIYSTCIHTVCMLYDLQDPRPWIHIPVYPDPCPVPHETTNTVILFTTTVLLAIAT